MARPGPDPEKVTEAERMAGEGKTCAQIGETLGVSAKTVSRWLGRPAGYRKRSADPKHHSPGWRQRERGGESPGSP